MSERGRPTKATPAQLKAIVHLARTTTLGQDAIAEACGIHRDTLSDWLKAGKNGRRGLSAFYREYKEARAAMERDLLGEAVRVAQGKASRTKVTQVLTPRLDAKGKPIWETNADGKRVQAMDERKDRTIVTETIPPDPIALVMLLERYDPSKYGRMSRVEALQIEAGRNAGDIHLVVSSASDAQIREAIRRMSPDDLTRYLEGEGGILDTYLGQLLKD